jgi:adenylate kinase family enzyme
VRWVILYGPPGVGKLTVGTQLARLTGFKLLHNHLSVNIVTAVFERGSEPWGRVLQGVRRVVLVEAARQGVDVITTNVFNGEPDTVDVWHTTFAMVREAGGFPLLVKLSCDRDELFRRVVRESRVAHQKLTTVAGLEAMMARYDLTKTFPGEPHLEVDVTNLPPLETAERIVAYYGL